jgi:hypothetical protein
LNREPTAGEIDRRPEPTQGVSPDRHPKGRNGRLPAPRHNPLIADIRTGKARFAPTITDTSHDHDKTMDRFFFTAGAIAAFIAVALGAFGAHSLKSKISAEMLTIFEVGVRYQI